LTRLDVIAGTAQEKTVGNIRARDGPQMAIKENKRWKAKRKKGKPDFSRWRPPYEGHPETKERKSESDSTKATASKEQWTRRKGS